MRSSRSMKTESGAKFVMPVVFGCGDGDVPVVGTMISGEASWTWACLA